MLKSIFTKKVFKNPLKVENMQDLLSIPPPNIAIMSLTFDVVIKNKMINLGFNPDNIITLRELLHVY